MNIITRQCLPGYSQTRLAALERPIAPEALDRISPWRFAAPLSPDMAAAREGRALDYEALLEFCHAGIAAGDGMLFIEGVGGVMVPLDAEHTVLDWMIEIDLPLIVVVGSYVGTLSHTLSALDVLDRHDLKVLAVVISESAGSAVSLDYTAATIRRFAAGTEVLAVPRLPSELADHPAMAAIADLL